MVIEISDETVKAYQVARLQEKAAPKSINDEVGFLLRIIGKQGDLIRTELRSQKALKLPVSKRIGKAFEDLTPRGPLRMLGITLQGRYLK